VLIFASLIVKTAEVQTVLIISSFVAASRVGATASAFCLRKLGHEVVILPTTLMGRHPGWGAPGGGAVDVNHLRDMWTAIKDQNIKFDAVLTGYMGQGEHIPLTVDIIQHVKSINPKAYVLVDPVMGDLTPDGGRLYIPELRAKAICNSLLPLADIITPNLWELGYITGQNLSTAQDSLAALRGINASAIITSVPFKDEIGAVLYDGNVAAQSHHEKFARVPHGGGDSLAGLYLGHYLCGDTARLAMRKSVSTLFQIMRMAQEIYHGTSEKPMGELPLIQSQDAILNSPPLDFIELTL